MPGRSLPPVQRAVRRHIHHLDTFSGVNKTPLLPRSATVFIVKQGRINRIWARHFVKNVPQVLIHLKLEPTRARHASSAQQGITLLRGRVHAALVWQERTNRMLVLHFAKFAPQEPIRRYWGPTPRRAPSAWLERFLQRLAHHRA